MNREKWWAIRNFELKFQLTFMFPELHLNETWFYTVSLQLFTYFQIEIEWFNVQITFLFKIRTEFSTSVLAHPRETWNMENEYKKV